MRGVVCGVGINDADYLIVKKEQYIGPDGSIKIKKTTCPFYRAWADMLYYRSNNKIKEEKMICGSILKEQRKTLKVFHRQ